MKNLFGQIGLVLAVVAACCLPAAAQQNPSQSHSSAGGTWNATAASTVLGFDGLSGGTPVVTELCAASDLVSSRVQFYKCGNPTVANYVSTTTSVPVNTTNGFVSGDVIVIYHAALGTYEKRILTTFTSSTNLTVTVAPTTALAVGDLVWDAQVGGAIAWGVSTNTINGPALIAGQAGKPLLLDITGTASCNIWSATAAYR